MNNNKSATLTGLEIAVIGMSGRFPGAENIQEFWDNLINGRETVSFFSDEELLKVGVDWGELEDPNYVKAFGILDDIENFDPGFFGYSPADAKQMDPQMRLFHEYAWTALEDAGYDPGTYSGLIGLYVGASPGDTGELFSLATLNNKDYISTRTSFKLNLKGPCSTIFNACSTSLIATHLACQALLSGDCDMALAGGAALSLPQEKTYHYQEGMIYSPDGHCRTFDAKANGSVFGNGIAVVLLKRIKEAIKDRDHIYALIKGTAINNDGSRKIGYTAPSIEGQAEVIRTALQMAGVDPESISFIEAHGTATPLGDTIEIEALRRAFNTDKKGFCAVGTVKTNLGHLDAAAGVTGLIKTALVLKHKRIPPNIHFQSPNPEIDFENSPFYVNTELREWKNDKYPLRAGVSAFGIGGTNGHVILEEAPGQSAERQAQRARREYQLILLSAKTETALEKMTENLAEYFKKNLLNRANHENSTNPGLTLADAAYTLQVGRKVFNHRKMLICSTVNEAIEKLSSSDTGKVHTFCPGPEEKRIVFMFSGLGAQYENMGRELYETEPLFRREMDRCFDICNPLVDFNIKEILYPPTTVSDGRGGSPCPPDTEYSPLERSSPKGRDVSKHDIHHFEAAQLIIFIFEYALAKLLIQWGIKPHAMMGYSFGEYTAACLSGVFTLENALKLVAVRGRLIQKMSEGAMLSVPLPVSRVEPLLNDELSLSIDNGPSCIVSGSNQAIAAFEKQMKKGKILCMRVPASRAIHSHMTDPILKEFQEVLDTIPGNKPQIPYISNVTGDWITNEQAMDPGYWTKQLRQTVRFNDGMKRLVKESGTLFIEIGPGRDISALTTRYFQENSKNRSRVINLVRHPHQNIPDVYFLLNRIGHLWLYGQSVDWSKLYRQEKRGRIPLPTYPFEGRSYWIDENLLNGTAEMASQKSSKDQPEEFNHWFYNLSWKRSFFINRKTETTGGPSTWLVFVGKHSLGYQLLRQLEQQGEQVTVAAVGTGFTSPGEGQYTLNPKNEADYQALLSELKKAGTLPTRVIHLWGITGETPGIEIAGTYREANTAFESIDKIQELGFYSLVYFTRALGKLRLSQQLQVLVVTNDMQDVTGKEDLCPGKSTILGPVKVIPQEHPTIICRSIDITLTEPGEPPEKELVRHLLAEFTDDSFESVIAYRGRYRWVQTVEPRQLDEENTTNAGDILKENGVYLVTGGLGEIGLVLAEYSARYVKARLVLTGRSAFPPRDRWEHWLDNHHPEDPISAKIKKLKHMEELGGEIMISCVDTADYPRMQETITRVEEQWGPIDGVVHLAGTTGGPTFVPTAQIDKTACLEHFRAKVYGLLVLEKIFREKPLDFCWLMSSISSVLGGLGFAAYSAANNFMDAFVNYYNRLNTPNTIYTPWISVNWDILEPEQMKIAFQHILALDNMNQVLISTGGRLQQRIDRWIKLEPVRQDRAPVKNKAAFYPRPNLTSPYEPPTDSHQQKIIDLWQQLFGFELIGIRDDFFELGGDSLKAITVIAHIHKELNVEIPIQEFFYHPTIKYLAGYIKQAENIIYSSIQPAEKKEYYPLSSAQQRFYILQQMEPGIMAYNLTLIKKLEVQLDGEKVRNAFQQLINRHESLRTSFQSIKEKIVQRIHENINFTIEYIDTPASEPGKLFENFVKCFDLDQTPLLRLGFIKLGEREHIVVLDMHHIITDGLSLDIFFGEFTAFYENRELPPLELQYKDFCQWQYDMLASGKLKKQEKYWLEEFSGKLPVLDMPTDYQRPHIQSFEGDIITFRLDRELTRKLNQLIKETGTTLFMMLLALYNILLSKYTGQDDIIIGTTTAGRNQVELGYIIGLFIETLVTRNYPQENKTFEEFLQEAKTNTLNAFENRAYPFRELVKHVWNENDVSRNPLFDAMLIVQNFNSDEVEPGVTDLKATPYEGAEPRVSKVDISLEAREMENGISFALEYCTKLFKKDTMDTFITYFKKIALIVVDNKKIKLKDIRLSHDFREASPGVYDESEDEFEF
jgi:acyl transferase domain-containing protein/acyl carrier protein